MTQNRTIRALSASAARASARAGPSCALSWSTAWRKRSNCVLPASTCAMLRGPPGFELASAIVRSAKLISQSRTDALISSISARNSATLSKRSRSSRRSTAASALIRPVR
jgi:hypothetical protein